MIVDITCPLEPHYVFTADECKVRLIASTGPSKNKKKLLLKVYGDREGVFDFMIKTNCSSLPPWKIMLHEKQKNKLTLLIMLKWKKYFKQ